MVNIIKGLRVKNCGGSAVRIEGDCNVEMSDLTFKNIRGAGIEVSEKARWTIEDIRMSGVHGDAFKVFREDEDLRKFARYEIRRRFKELRGLPDTDLDNLVGEVLSSASLEQATHAAETVFRERLHGVRDWTGFALNVVTFLGFMLE